MHLYGSFRYEGLTMDDRITPAMVKKAQLHGQLFLKALQKLVGVFYGPSFKLVIVLSDEGKADSLAMMSDIDDDEIMQAILTRAADISQRRDMVDASKPLTEH